MSGKAGRRNNTPVLSQTTLASRNRFLFQGGRRLAARLPDVPVVWVWWQGAALCVRWHRGRWDSSALYW
ncbi:hypothetical protein Q5P01_020949 [Channa striata]|uniref:Uncharacterized protein n=1 Tax=Channa striata TaxID=64152 RepID=A0AA88S9K8_CHASR|nr:hypothetical protein Q5P01_020949 [Channa striata]